MNSKGSTLRTRIVPTLAQVDADAFDALCTFDSPFVRHRFLLHIETSGSVGLKTGWYPAYVLCFLGEALVGAMPLYQRSHSYGEYIFDFAWAQASERAGLPYYPKWTCAVPFTPATGPRLLVDEAQALRCGTSVAAVQSALVQAALQQAQAKGHSLHVLFCLPAEAQALSGMGLWWRKSFQFHFKNEGYSEFDDFLSALSHGDRKNIKRERRRVVESGLQVKTRRGDALTVEEWQRVFALYTSTSDRKWGSAYLTASFFVDMPTALARDALVSSAHAPDGTMVAMALSFVRGRHCYGRYWGTSVDVPGLHFELCYYQLIEHAIANGMTLVEAGAQGEHKLKRGFLPSLTHSAHVMFDAQLHRAVGRFVEAEARGIDEEVAVLQQHSPFRST